MGSKCKLIIGIASVLLLTIIVIIMYSMTLKAEDYNSKLISALNEQEKVTVQDVFAFDFARAYVFNDSYISGEGFAKRYSLNISINQVKPGVSENIQRIIFVDELGSFVYEFKCDNSEVILSPKGIVLYPKTTIKRESPIHENPLVISFESSDHYDSKIGG